MIRSKIRYFTRSLYKRACGFASLCPNCSSQKGEAIDSKFLVTKLIECADCHLLYRSPTDTREESDRYYQSEYRQGNTTELPTRQSLADLTNNGFVDFSKSYARFLDLFDALNLPRATRIIDFGCSWGYGAFQFEKAGMAVEGFELSIDRAAFAREKLNLKVSSDLNRLGSGFDVFFSSHVLEHVSSLKDTFALARKITNPGGLFVSITPNGSPEFRRTNWTSFHHLWGLPHPNLLQASFVERAFAARPLFLASDPYPLESIRAWNRQGIVKADLTGWELLIIAVL